ncbi:MAG: SRPBCC domain-containing protein [Pseudobdellovibrio sp.]
MKHQSKTERISDRELVVSRIINGPAHLVFEAWTQPELFKKWWVPKGAPITLIACELDVRTGGTYRLKFNLTENSQTVEFFGKYIDVIPGSRIVWTNEEGGDVVVTTVTFKETNGTTLVTVHDLYPSKEALEEAIANGSTSGMPAQLDQLDEFIAN